MAPGIGTLGGLVLSSPSLAALRVKNMGQCAEKARAGSWKRANLEKEGEKEKQGEGEGERG